MTLPFEVPAESVLRERGSAKWTAFPDAIGAFVAEMDFGIAPVVRAAIDAELDAARTGYLPLAASTALAEATAAWSAERYDWPIRPDQVRPVADVLTGLDLVLRRYSDPSKPVIVPTPAYMPFLQIPQRHGREIIEVPSPEVDGRYELDLAGIAAAFEAGADVLVLCNPWNPVGRVLTRDELVAVSEVVDRVGGRVFADEIHAPVVFPGQRHVPYASVSDAAAAHTITAISASKAFNLPGLKCAQLVLSNDADAERYAEVAGLVAHGAAGFGVAANTAAYTEGGPWLDGVLEYLDASRTRVGELLAERLPQVGYRAPEGSYIAWLDVRALDLGDAPAEAIRERAGVALTDGAACGEAGRGFVRLILATPLPVLEEIVDRLARAFG
ncbi:aminotransferase class I/II-fold pyridoxal phosphate-dependent enzyme [Amnibacterium soli]|uniref:cysteine-S-conjugate beta-lyase n=1 Tax=Amnibacterium soli TaxID=1282736 RepID=A0ABP8YN69_9MICO